MSKNAKPAPAGAEDSHEAIWDRFAFHGAPLSVLRPVDVTPTQTSLIEAIADAERSLLAKPNQAAFGRKRDAFVALLLAVRLHYPDFFERFVFPRLHKDWMAQDSDGKVIKLKRICVQTLADYL